MTVHAWLVAATGLTPSNIWRAYQNNAHEPPEGTDFVTYHIGADTPEEIPGLRQSLIDPATVANELSSENEKTIVLRCFGPNRSTTARNILMSSRMSSARRALLPATIQRPGGAVLPIREEREQGWIEYLQFDMLIHEMSVVTENIPSIQSSDLTGDVSGDLEVVEP